MENNQKSVNLDEIIANFDSSIENSELIHSIDMLNKIETALIGVLVSKLAGQDVEIKEEHINRFKQTSVDKANKLSELIEKLNVQSIQ